MTDVGVEKVQIASNSCGLKDFNEIHFFFIFLFPPPGSLFLAGLSEKQVINLVWPYIVICVYTYRPLSVWLSPELQALSRQQSLLPPAIWEKL